MSLRPDRGLRGIRMKVARDPWWRRLGAIGIAAFMTAGCSWLGGTADRVLPDRRPDYRAAQEVERLEIPPDLSRLPPDDALVLPGSDGTATYSEYAGRATGGGAGRVLPVARDVRMVREGDRRWLVVRAEPERVWKWVKDFVAAQGYEIRREDPSVGILETGWVETRIDVPVGALRRLVGKMFGASYGAGIRDRFRIRIERGKEPGTTEVYVTHYGVQEVYATDDSLDFDSAWQPRPRDPELEAEVLARMVVFLAGEEVRTEARAERKPTVSMEGGDEGPPRLRIEAGFSRAWRMVGLALDRAGFTVVDRDRVAGVYFVRYAAPRAGAEGQRRGLLARLAFWRRPKVDRRAEPYRIRVSRRQGWTVVEVSGEGDRPVPAEDARHILELIRAQIG